MNISSLPLDLFRSYVVFIESPNMVVAAERLKVSQPLLTKHIQIIEANSSQPLFQFVGRKKVPTHQGQALYDLLRRQLDELESGLQNLDLMQSDPSRLKIRIGGRPEILARIAPQLSFTGRIEFLPLSGQEVITALQEGKLEIGISQHQADSYSLIQKPYLKDHFQLIFPKIWNIDDQKFSDCLKSLLEKPYLSYGTSDPLVALTDQAIKPFRTFAHWPTLIEMVQEKKGWSLVPSLYLQETSGIQSVPVPEKILSSTQFSIFYSREYSKLPWFQDLLKQI